MDELDEARAELRQLKGTERTLFKQLVEIRAYIKAQKGKIDELIKKRPPPINRLPVELLSRIISLCLPPADGAYHEKVGGLQNCRTHLSTVSRFWRNVILTTPELWSDFVVWSKSPPVASVEAQLTRSGNIPLSIFILNLPHRYQKLDLQWLDVLVSSANRWRCLHTQDMPPEILRILEGLKFPSLEDVSIDRMDEVPTYYPRFLLPSRAPALRNLQLECFVPTPKIAAATTLETLEMTFKDRRHRNQIVNPTFIPTQSITTLLLAGSTTGWVLLPDSIHLAHLKEFKLAVDNPKPVMKAIVAPKLMCFDYSADRLSSNQKVGFDIGSKFSHVQSITLRLGYSEDGIDALCQEFHGVRRVNLHVDTIYAVFTPEAQLGDLESVPADHWTSLESLTIRGSYCYGDFDFLVRWLTKRLELGWPRLSVRLSGLSNNLEDGVDFHNMYNKLRTCSNLEVDDVELKSSVHCSTSNGLFHLDLFGVEPFVADDMFLDCRIPSRCSMKTCTPQSQ